MVIMFIVYFVHRKSLNMSEIWPNLTALNFFAFESQLILIFMGSKGVYKPESEKRNFKSLIMCKVSYKRAKTR